MDKEFSALKLDEASLEAAIWSVGNGEQINIRRDKWLLSGRIGGPANRGDPERVSELIKQDQNCWDEPKLNSMFEEQLVQEIKAIKVHPQSTADKLIWTGTKNGTYTVKSNYNLICQEQALTVSLGASSSHQVDQQLWRRIWQMHTPSKIRNFMWLLCQNAIATKENLFKRKMVTHPLCPICQTNQETTEHLFLLCGWTAEIWRHPSLQTNTQAHQVTRLDSWLCQFIANRPDLPNFEQIAVTLWHMWKARNEAVFRGKPIFPWMVVEAANSLLSIHQKWNGNQLKNQKGHRSKENRWSPPDPRSIKANIDATYLPDGETGAIACVCRNSDGVVVGGFVRDAEISSAEQAELTAFVETLKFISERGDLNWILESDCANLISSFTSADQVGDKLSWKLRPLIHEAHGLIKTIPHLQLQFCYRECNRVADWVLKAHRKHALPHSWVFNPPTILVDLLCFDAPVVGSWTFRK